MKQARLALAFSLLTSPAIAQSEIGESPALQQGAVTCAEYLRMDLPARYDALEGVEPMGGELAGSDPDLVRQWSEDVATSCEGHPDRTLSEAATEALATP